MVQLAKLPPVLEGWGLEMHPGSLREIESLESKLLGLPSVKYSQASYFAPGVWVRELRILGPRREDPLTWALVIGHEHIHGNLNIMGKGEKIVVIGDRVERMVPPYCVFSGAGVRKVGLIIEEMVWYSIHHNPTDERDEDALEALFYRKSDSWKQHHAQEVRDAEIRLRDIRDKMGPLAPRKP